ncbi:LuxR C-terminal-related transcriptional regulator [Streptomyces sp. NPDC048277]|uniref:LuxR C-terminal-related transcriptional regulator n=1 Tax=Streptomyces sp. NPDC048277 TaxID=3155027 RepID=UPI0033C543CE
MAGKDEYPRRPAAVPADQPGEPFLRTRFAVPARPPTFLRRTRLADHLDQALDRPLTMVNGAAGAGKTLLVADWAAGLGQPVAWLTVEAADQGSGRFWAYVLHALHDTGTPLPDGVSGPDDAGRVDHRLLARIADTLNRREPPAILVLDEFDRLAAPEAAEQLEFVLHHAGAGLRLILITRSEPLLPLHRYRSAGAVTEIRNAELAFTTEEAAELLARHGLRLPTEAVRALVERTGGWAAGLRLCALAAQQSADPQTYLKEFEAGHSMIAEFLLAEVLKAQPAETQDLLLRLSVLDGFCPELAEAVADRGGVEARLAELHGQNAFVEDLGHSWYRLHPLFAEILRVHLRARFPGLEPDLQLRAARWLRDSGAVPEALAHGAAAGDWEFTAGTLVDDLALGRLFAGPAGNDVTELFSGMDPDATGAAVDLVRAARGLAGPDLGAGLAHLARAEEDLPAGPSAAAGRLSCALLEALAARLTGDPGRAEQAMSAALRLLREVPEQLLAKHPELTALLLGHLGSTRVWAGRFDEARAVLTEVLAGPCDAATALPREDCLAHLALIDFLGGWIGRAETEALTATAAPYTDGRHHPSAGLAQLVLAAVAVDRDELDRARALLAEAAGLGSGLSGEVVARGSDPPTEAVTFRSGQRAEAAPGSGLPGDVVAPGSDPPGEAITPRFGLPGEAAIYGSGLPAEATVPGPGLPGEVVVPGSDPPGAVVARGSRLPGAVVAPGSGSPDPVTEAVRALVTGRLLLALGEPRAAVSAVEAGVPVLAASPWAEAHAALALSAVQLAEGRPEAAAKVLDDLPWQDEPGCAAELAWARFAAGRRPEAVEAAERLCGTDGAGPGVTVRATLVRARAAAEAGDTGTAGKLLARALLDARRDRLRRPFLDAGPGIRRLLESPPLRGLAAGWLFGDGGHGAGEESPVPVVEELSVREREVLTRLAQLMSTQEIAADLYVSVNTVKTHLKSVYRKLGVGRRGDAVRRARDRGLL